MSPELTYFNALLYNQNFILLEMHQCLILSLFLLFLPAGAACFLLLFILGSFYGIQVHNNVQHIMFGIIAILGKYHGQQFWTHYLSIWMNYLNTWCCIVCPLTLWCFGCSLGIITYQFFRTDSCSYPINSNENTTKQHFTIMMPYKLTLSSWD